MIDNGKLFKSLCSQCGLCIPFCPTDALLAKPDENGLYYPHLIEEKCIECDVCNKVCPSYGFEEDEIAKALDINKNGHDTKCDPLLGNYINTYYGWATDEFIRRKAASGGIVTALFKFMLDRGIVDGVVIIKTDPAEPFRPVATITDDWEEIKRSMGSKYCPVSLEAVLLEIKKRKDLRGVAIAGLPCQIEGIRKAEGINRHFKDKIKCLIGVYCKQTKDLRFSDYILSRMGIRRESVAEMNFRGEGWPGHIQVKLKNGQTRLHPFHDVAISRTPWLNFNFSPAACLVCDDATAEFSDIATGDAWIPEFRGDGKGVSLFCSRTARGEDILKSAIREGYLEAGPIAAEKIIESQYRKAIILKKKNRQARAFVFRLFDRSIPIETIDKSRVTPVELLDAVWILMIRGLFSSWPVAYLMSKAPAIVHKVLAKIPLSFRLMRRERRGHSLQGT